ncbi:unnamed protein product (mitochondrion) [Plasmodiophora brassicae]|uniref:Phosphoadenosine phosphosulphate reductase domain-containing protein n=1 Tax=Plasmodiophora brassicae TaxID=37360 RepID=A0A3P3YAV0_PLABS|nr:unnamed protein product [Plasmodiophora brassicae]
MWTKDQELVVFESSDGLSSCAGVRTVFTGRWRSQAGQRSNLDVLERDPQHGIIKINPMAMWSISQFQDYIREHSVPYNPLVDLGDKSIGDWHSTKPSGDGEGERERRWNGTVNTECGLLRPPRYPVRLRLKSRSNVAAANNSVENESDAHML